MSDGERCECGCLLRDHETAWGPKMPKACRACDDCRDVRPTDKSIVLVNYYGLLYGRFVP